MYNRFRIHVFSVPDQTFPKACDVIGAQRLRTLAKLNADGMATHKAHLMLPKGRHAASRAGNQLSVKVGTQMKKSKSS